MYNEKELKKAIKSPFVYDEVFIVKEGEKVKKYLETIYKRFSNTTKQMKKEFTV